MRVRRDVSSIPFRSARETWQRIIDLVTGPGSKDVEQLKSATGVSRANSRSEAISGNTATQSFNKAKKLMREVFARHERTFFCGCAYGENTMD